MSLPLVGDRIDEVQRRQAVEAMLVGAALDRLLLPFLDRRELAAGARHQHRLAAGVMHEHAFLRIDEQRLLDVGLDAQRADQRFRLRRSPGSGSPRVLRPAITRATACRCS